MSLGSWSVAGGLDPVLNPSSRLNLKGVKADWMLLCLSPPLKGLGPRVPVVEKAGLGRARISCCVLVRSLLGPGQAEARDDVLAGPGYPDSQQEGAATSPGGRVTRHHLHKF